jgi:hypothetical protein
VDNQHPLVFIPIIDLQSFFSFFSFLQINMTTILKNIRKNIEKCICIYFIIMFVSVDIPI